MTKRRVFGENDPDRVRGLRLYAGGMAVSQIANLTGLNRKTFYRWLEAIGDGSPASVLAWLTQRGHGSGVIADGRQVDLEEAILAASTRPAPNRAPDQARGATRQATREPTQEATPDPDSLEHEATPDSATTPTRDSQATAPPPEATAPPETTGKAPKQMRFQVIQGGPRGDHPADNVHFISPAAVDTRVDGHLVASSEMSQDERKTMALQVTLLRGEAILDQLARVRRDAQLHKRLQGWWLAYLDPEEHLALTYDRAHLANLAPSERQDLCNQVRTQAASVLFPSETDKFSTSLKATVDFGRTTIMLEREILGAVKAAPGELIDKAIAAAALGSQTADGTQLPTEPLLANAGARTLDVNSLSVPNLRAIEHVRQIYQQTRSADTPIPPPPDD